MKWRDDLIKDIRSFTSYDDEDVFSDLIKHPFGYDDFALNIQANPDMGYEEVTECNRQALLFNFLRIKEKCKSILEIGIGRNDKKSFSYVFTENKNDDTVYVGIDIEDRSFLNDPAKNIHTFVCDSSNYSDNLKLFKGVGVSSFDFIFIDGWHSINQVLRDWEYTNLLTDNGIVGFHDVSCHPGPYYFTRYLDRDKWVVGENCCPKDWGVSFVNKKYECN